MITESSSKPLVSVVMPIYNAEMYLSEAIESILKQTYPNFEFIIISDDSSENTIEILDNFQKIDKRIKVIHQTRKGLIASLNKGLELTQGKYIARMDADDISHHCRFEIQVDFMESHPEIAVCGTWVGSIGVNQGFFWKFSRKPETNECLLLFGSPLAHPSVMIRKNILNLFNIKYNPDYDYAEDYQFLTKISEHSQLINIPKVLVYYRFHDKNASLVYKKEQEGTTLKIQIELLNKLGVFPSPDELKIHQSLGSWDFKVSKTYLLEVQNWLCKIQITNEKNLIYSRDTLNQVLAELWCIACFANIKWGFWTWKKLWNSPLLKSVHSSKLLQIIFCLNLIWILKFRN